MLTLFNTLLLTSCIYHKGDLGSKVVCKLRNLAPKIFQQKSTSNFKVVAFYIFQKIKSLRCFSKYLMGMERPLKKFFNFLKYKLRKPAKIQKAITVSPTN